MVRLNASPMAMTPRLWRIAFIAALALLILALAFVAHTQKAEIQTEAFAAPTVSTAGLPIHRS